jgi:hypothetical protein
MSIEIGRAYMTIRGGFRFVVERIDGEWAYDTDGYVCPVDGLRAA